MRTNMWPHDIETAADRNKFKKSYVVYNSPECKQDSWQARVDKGTCSNLKWHSDEFYYQYSLTF